MNDMIKNPVSLEASVSFRMDELDGIKMAFDERKEFLIRDIEIHDGIHAGRVSAKVSMIETSRLSFPSDWNGEGLPQAGQKVLFDNFNGMGVIYGHEDFGSTVEIVMPLPNEECCVVRLQDMLGVFHKSFFRPIETEEQKKEREIDELLELALDHCSMSDSYKINLRRLLDAGMLIKKPE